MGADGRKPSRGGAADGDAQGVRRRQLVLFSVIAAAVLIVLAAWLTAGGGKGPAPAGGIEAELAGPDMPEKVWTRRSEARFGAIETRLREMQGEARRLAAENERLRERLVGDAENARGGEHCPEFAFVVGCGLGHWSTPATEQWLATQIVAESPAESSTMRFRGVVESRC